MRLVLLAAALALSACSPAATTSTSTSAATASTSEATNTAPAADVQMAAPVPASVTTGGIHVVGPVANSRTNSPLVATGEAPNNWYFEAQFTAQLIAADGHIIAEAPARAMTDWTKPGIVPFMVQMPFQVARETQATLLLQEDMPPDEDHPENRPTREIRIPVTLAP